jgi:hypothetical protein
MEILIDAAARSAHVPALPAARTESAVLEMAGPVFVKPKLNIRKGVSPLAYTRWDSGAALYAAAWGEFSSSETDLGGLVAVPDMGYPMANLEIDFAVNASSQVGVMRCFTHGFTAHNRPSDMVSGATAPAELMTAVQNFCVSHGIVGGVFNIQAVQHEGQWKVMDWNTRPTGMYNVIGGDEGVGDIGLAHMLSIPYTASEKHIELRSFWSNPIPNDKAEVVRSCGLTPSWVWHRESIGRVYGVGADAAEVQAKFEALEAALS